jgi:ABC-type multidrug transport system fused ATPase/permease subunit
VAAYRGLLSTYLRPHARLVGGLAALLLANIAVQVLSPQLLGMFIDSALHGGLQRDLLPIAAAFLAASLVQQALLIGATYLSERVAWTSTNALRAAGRSIGAGARRRLGAHTFPEGVPSGVDRGGNVPQKGPLGKKR